MTENEWKLLIAILTLGLLCLVAIGVGLRLVVLDAIDRIVYKASHRTHQRHHPPTTPPSNDTIHQRHHPPTTPQACHQQLLLDAESMRNGQCLRPLRGDPSSVNRKLLAALNRV